MSASTEHLPSYAAPDAKSALLAAGVSGTIYSLVMPESEAALAALVRDEEALFDRYREPWTQKKPILMRGSAGRLPLFASSLRISPSATRRRGRAKAFSS